MSDAEICIEFGFLQLNGMGGIVSVKGSAITCVQTRQNAPVHSLVTIGDNGWFVEVVEKRERILRAIAESYKQAARR